MAAIRPVGVNTTFATGTTSVSSGNIPQRSDTIRVVAEGEGVYVAIGTLPVATNENIYVPTTNPTQISLGPVRSQPVVGVITGAQTILQFQEGTGSGFVIGDAVSLTCEGLAAYDFEHQIVTNVNTSAGVHGYFSTRITVDVDTSSVTDPFITPEAMLRQSVRVACLTASGTGTVNIQQVQVS